MPRKPKVTEGEVLKDLATKLRSAALHPNLNGYKPHDKQIDFHAKRAHGRLFLGGNRSGKTVGGAVEACWWLTGRHPYIETPPPPVRGRCISVDFLNGVEKIVRPEIARWLPASELRGGSWSNAYNKELRTLFLENGSFLEFMSYDQELDKFAGTSRHFVWFDEEPPQEIFIENKMRLLDTGGAWWVTMTPVEGMTWIYDDVYMAAQTNDNIHVVEVDMAENIYLNHEEVDAMLVGLSADERKARKEGKFVQIGGLIFKEFGEANIIDPIIPPRDWLHVASLDHGYNNPTAWLWAAVDKDGRIVVYDEHYESGQVISYHAQKVHQINALHEREIAYYVGDPSIRNSDPITGTSVLIEYIESGIPLILGNNDVRAGIDKVAKHIRNPETGKPRLFITKNCVNLIHELQRYRWGTWATKKMQNQKNKKEEPHKKHDHAVDALRYLISSRPAVEDMSLPKPDVPYSAAISPYEDLKDRSLQIAKRKYDLDPHLGSEW